MGNNTTNCKEEQFPTTPTAQNKLTNNTQKQPPTNRRQHDKQNLDNIHIFQPTNKKNHKPIQKHKHKNSFQKHQHITTTYKTQV
jgi:hypothetical protein